jgi:riboflavin synthase
VQYCIKAYLCIKHNDFCNYLTKIFSHLFTGIIETTGIVRHLKRESQNLHLSIESAISHTLHIDQSVSHNGVCLTVVATNEQAHTVTAVAETLQRSNLGSLQVGSPVNLERCLRADSRIDGHFVQGHIDQTAICQKIEDAGGSWNFYFEYERQNNHILVPKGSICIDGVSLTVVNCDNINCQFSVTIIPYTYQHTLFGQYKAGTVVNIEFDIIGKYISELSKLQTATFGNMGYEKNA